MILRFIYIEMYTSNRNILNSSFLFTCRNWVELRVCRKHYYVVHLEEVDFLTFMGPSWSWSYGHFIYNFICNQCPSPPMLWVRISIRAWHYVIKFVSDLRKVGGFLRVLRFPPSIKLTATI